MEERLHKALEERRGWVAETLPTAVDGRAIVGNPINGDVMYLGISVERSTEIVQEYLWRVEGSTRGTAIAALLLATCTGKTMAELQALRIEELMLLGGFTDLSWKHHVELVEQAIQKVCNNYFAKTGQRERITKEERMIVCACKDVTDVDIRQVYLRGNQRLEDIKAATGAGQECDMCTERLVALHEELCREFPMNGNVHIRG